MELIAGSVGGSAKSNMVSMVKPHRSYRRAVGREGAMRYWKSPSTAMGEAEEGIIFEDRHVTEMGTSIVLEHLALSISVMTSC